MMERRVLGRNLKKEGNESTTPVVPIGPLPSTPSVSSWATSHPPEEALASYLLFLSLIKSLGSLITFIQSVTSDFPGFLNGGVPGDGDAIDQQ